MKIFMNKHIKWGVFVLLYTMNAVETTITVVQNNDQSVFVAPAPQSVLQPAHKPAARSALSIPGIKSLIFGTISLYVGAYAYILYSERQISALALGTWRKETPLLALVELDSALIIQELVGDLSGIARVEKIIARIQEIAAEEKAIARYLWLTRFKGFRLLSHQVEFAQACSDYRARLNFLKNTLISALAYE